MTGFAKRQIHALNKAIVDDREERNEHLKIALIKANHDIATSVLKTQRSFNNDFSLLDQLTPNRVSDINLVGGVPYQCKIIFGDWKGNILLNMTYPYNLLTADLTVRGCYPSAVEADIEGSSFRIFGNKPEIVTILPPPIRKDPNDLICFLTFDSLVGMTLECSPQYDFEG
jgi:hypothetical protein